MNSPLVSLIMPLYNAERYVYTALQSVLSHNLAMEVIVVDDGSTDRSLHEVQRIHDPRIRVLRNREKGIAAALNTGLTAAQGEIVVRCDADDRYPADRLPQQVAWLSQHPEFAAVCGNYLAIDPKGKLVIQFDCGAVEEEITQELQAGITRTHFCTFAIRTHALQALGGFRDYFASAEDIDLQLRLGDRFRVGYLPQVCYHYRLHSASITHTKSSSEREFFDTTAREFQQQRHLSGKDNLQRGCPPPVPSPGKSPFTAAEHIQAFLLSRAWQEFRKGQRRQAFVTGMQAALSYPQNLSVWRSLLALWVKSLNYKALLFKHQWDWH